MKPKTMILLVVAVGCGLGASIMTSRLLADRQKPDEGEPTVAVLVAKARVAPWTPIKEPEKLFEVKQFPASVAPKRPVGDFEELKDQKLNKAIGEGQTLLKDDLLNKEQTRISDNLLPGQRAVAIKVTAESTVAGFVLPGSRVDVVVTVRGAEASSKLILQNMLVMAVDNNDTNQPETKSILGQTVTLAATTEEAGRLTLAQSMGELRLLLKAHGDTSRITNFDIKPADLKRPARDGSKPEEETVKVEKPATTPPLVPLGQHPPEDPKVVVKEDPRPKPAPRKKPHVMRIITGGTAEKIMFPDDKDEDDAAVPAGAPDRKPGGGAGGPDRRPSPPEAKPAEKAGGRVGRTRTGK